MKSVIFAVKVIISISVDTPFIYPILGFNNQFNLQVVVGLNSISCMIFCILHLFF